MWLLAELRAQVTRLGVALAGLSARSTLLLVPARAPWWRRQRFTGREDVVWIWG